jgi:hypothetical protein
VPATLPEREEFLSSPSKRGTDVLSIVAEARATARSAVAGPTARHFLIKE